MRFCCADEEVLRRIADKTGGRYFRAVDRDSLKGVYNEIDQLEKTEVTEMRYLRYQEHFGYFVTSGLGFLVVGALLAGSLFRKLP